VGRTTGLGTIPPTNTADIRATGPGQGADIPHAASIGGLFTQQIFAPGCQPCTVGRDARYLSVATHNPITGALESSTARLSIFGQRGGASSNAFSTSDLLEFGSPGAPGGHPVPRSGDGYVALDLASGSDVDIQSISYPGETVLTPAPAPITTADPERMPAWSPDGIKLGFIRTTGGRRHLGIFNATPGIQTIVNPLVDLGADAPTPQTRQFESVYGGLAVAESSESSIAPQINCNASCINALSNIGQPPLKPKLSFTTSGQTIGIFVVRVTGKRKLLGRSVPKVRLVGRVPLGKTRKGTNRFRWNLKVNGKRLKPGTYLLTYRALKRNKVLNTSDSIRFTVTKSGKIRSPRRQR
jgi:hypothetical protein